MRIFLDVNVLLKEEARRNLERKFPDRLPLFGRQLQFIRLVADNPSLPCPVALAKKDWPIYRTARACKADVLLTGYRRDFGSLIWSLANGQTAFTVPMFEAFMQRAMPETP